MQEMNLTKVIVGGVSQQQDSFDYDMAELTELAKANNMTVVATVNQNLDKPIAATYFGIGKIDEIRQLAEENEATVLVLNDELTPSQIRNLEKGLGKLILMDRTRLILAIFANRAKSKEAKMQVQIARLRYELPRLRAGEQANLMQQGGGPGFANRGSGETKLELNQRTIKNQITHLNHELKTMETAQQTMRKQRDKTTIPTVALVGYTNAGKSTTLNGLLRLFDEQETKQVFEKDMLFATLDTSVREINLPDKKKFLLSDTVGFINKLPTQLIKAFRSTLAEAAQADLLIQVIDFSDPHYEEMIKVTEKTLNEMGVTDIPMIYAYNKADLRKDTRYPLQNGEHNLVYAANDPASLKLLTKMITATLFADMQQVTFLIPFAAGKWVDYLNENTSIVEQTYTETGTKIKANVLPIDHERLSQYEITD
ncbi:GTPase HflX [Loigolactobacillus backii]|uniref:GTPase HflX n=1 Tax=Loigolactobacillus backii TaxID=375175 RepID=UPI000C1C97B4|nr:GTPase HflX [Loigolactobacillus backii]PIO82225.1 GTPase HflX [Loigolactobacillus backii]